MPSKSVPLISSAAPARWRIWLRVALLGAPFVLVAGAAARAGGQQASLLWLGATIELAICALALVYGPGWEGSVDLAVIILYVIGIGWLIGASQARDDWYIHLATAVLLVVPLASYAAKFLRESGAPALRQARLLAERLARRQTWPIELADCRNLPEVAALRAVLHIDASPALGLLLANSRPQVRVAALAALDGRRDWKRGQAEVLFQMAREAAEPEIRVGVLKALNMVTERELVERVAEFLCDSSYRVRQAAVDVLLSDSDRKWNWIRPAVRRALADPMCQNDGPLRPAASVLGSEAMNDLTAWTTEKGLLGLRAALTLGDHYARVLAADSDSSTMAKMRAKVEDPHAPPMLRLEMAKLLHKHAALDPTVLRNLVSPSTPAPLRLLAVEGLLATGEAGQAVAALHDLARLPNREIALAVAEVAQRRLGVDFGLALDQPLPAVQSRSAAEVARRVLAWASQQEVGPEESSEVGSSAEDFS